MNQLLEPVAYESISRMLILSCTSSSAQTITSSPLIPSSRNWPPMKRWFSPQFGSLSASDVLALAWPETMALAWLSLGLASLFPGLSQTPWLWPGLGLAWLKPWLTAKSWFDLGFGLALSQAMASPENMNNCNKITNKCTSTINCILTSESPSIKSWSHENTSSV